ncbi:YbhB/YbcL family Raf kinase inhibitor-like protein [bacterium]|nr:YbhB/YbcL family Raf kinase inhibitor-like protein [bacterium]
MSMKVVSSAFADGHPIPERYTGDGRDVSPPLEFRDVPHRAIELALICDDPDAPTPQPWVHWVVWGIPPTVTGLPEALSAEDVVPLEGGGRLHQGRNSWQSGQVIGYRGPAPPRGHGTHHYHFRLLALDASLALNAGSTKEELLSAIQGHMLEAAELIGTYAR